MVHKGSLGTDTIENIEHIIGAQGQDNTIDGSTGTSGVTSFDVDLSKETLTVRDVPPLGDVTFSVKNFVNVIGTTQNDTIVGNDKDNTIEGGSGNDILKGSSGNDTLDGGAGNNDIADYGQLNQAITLEAVGVVHKGSLGTDTINNIEHIIGAQGQDNTIDGSTGTSGVTSFDVDLSKETLTVRDIPPLGDVTFSVKNFVNVIGTTQNDTIVGNDEDNIINGFGGRDYLTGKGGADTFVLGDGDGLLYADAGNSDKAIITDFQTGQDIIQLSGTIHDYVFGTSSGVTSIALDTHNNGMFDVSDELIANVTGSIDITNDLTFV